MRSLQFFFSLSAITPNAGFSTESLFRGLLGLFVVLAIAFIFSSNRKAINWKTTSVALFFQFLLALGILKVPAVQWFFNLMGQFFNNVLEYTRAGSLFIFGGLMNQEDPHIGYVFAFQILPTIVFFSALTSVLYYFGIIQKIVRGMAWFLTKSLRISGAESLSVAGNIFLGQTEAPLLIKGYLAKMTRSEIFLVMVGGMATVAGGVLASYIDFLGGTDKAMRLEFARHLIAASVMAAPGAILIAKILEPQAEEVDSGLQMSKQEIGSNVLDAISKGTSDGLKLAINVGGMLLVFIALIAMLNGILGFVGSVGGLNEWVAANSSFDALSLEAILGTLFAPLMWLIGVAKEDLGLMGQLLGLKLVASEFIAYTELVPLKDPGQPVHLAYQKSILMATYMLCGFANFASIGIQIGGIGSLAPNQRKLLSEFGLKAVLGGTLASLLSATFAGMILG